MSEKLENNKFDSEKFTHDLLNFMFQPKFKKSIKKLKYNKDEDFAKLQALKQPAIEENK